MDSSDNDRTASESAASGYPSLLTQWFKTNYAPTAFEAAHIRSVKDENSIKISALQAEIDSHLAVVDKLRAEQSALQTLIDPLVLLLSPARRLPSDTLRDIFVACTEVNGIGDSVMSCSEAPLLLSLVCKGWREIVLNTPKLWSSLHIPLSTISATNVLRHIGVKLWLERASGCELSVTLASADFWPRQQQMNQQMQMQMHQQMHVAQLPNPGPIPKEILAILDLIYPYRDRLASLWLMMPQPLAKLFVQTLTGDKPSAGKSFKLPALREFQIRPFNNRNMQGTLEDVRILESVYAAASPILRITSFSPYNCARDPLDPKKIILPRIPFNRLTDLDLARGHTSTLICLQILAACHSLVKCRLAIDDSIPNMFELGAPHPLVLQYSQPTNPAHIPHAVLPNLEVFGISQSDVGRRATASGRPAGVDIFDHLELGSLKSVEYREWAAGSGHIQERLPQTSRLPIEKTSRLPIEKILSDTVRTLSIGTGSEFPYENLFQMTPLLANLQVQTGPYLLVKCLMDGKVLPGLETLKMNTCLCTAEELFALASVRGRGKLKRINAIMYQARADKQYVPSEEWIKEQAEKMLAETGIVVQLEMKRMEKRRGLGGADSVWHAVERVDLVGQYERPLEEDNVLTFSFGSIPF